MEAETYYDEMHDALIRRGEEESYDLYCEAMIEAGEGLVSFEQFVYERRME